MKKLLLELFESTGQLAPQTIVLRMIVATVIAFFICLSYKLSHEGSIYSKKFNVSLMALTVITTAVMIVIGNNIAMSLGMVAPCLLFVFERRLRIHAIRSTYSGRLWREFAAEPAIFW